MAGGKGKSTGGKAGPKEAPGKSQKSHSAKAGLQVRDSCSSRLLSPCLFCARIRHLRRSCLASQPAIELHSLLEYDRDPGLSCASPILRPTRARLGPISVTRHFLPKAKLTISHSFIHWPWTNNLLSISFPAVVSSASLKTTLKIKCALARKVHPRLHTPVLCYCLTSRTSRCLCHGSPRVPYSRSSRTRRQCGQRSQS